MNKGIAIAKAIAEDELRLLKKVLKEEEDDWELLTKAMKPILDAYDNYIISGQSVTIGSGETTICIPTRHIQQLVRIWIHMNERPSPSSTTSKSACHR